MGRCVPVFGKRSLKIFTLTERTVNEAGFWPISLLRMPRSQAIPMTDLSFPQERRACEGVDLCYTLHLRPKTYRVVCLAFVSALAEFTKSRTLSLVAYRPEPWTYQSEATSLDPAKSSIGSLILSAHIPHHPQAIAFFFSISPDLKK